MQRPAHHNIEFLESTTYREQRHTGFERVFCDRQRQRIAMRIPQRIRIVIIMSIVVRLDVAGTAGQHDTIDLVDEFVDRKVVGEHRNYQWHRIGGLDDGLEVFFAHHVERVWIEDTSVRRYTNNRFGTHMGTNLGTDRVVGAAAEYPQNGPDDDAPREQ